MISIQELVHQQISFYHTDNVKELLDYHNIEVFYTDNVFNHHDSCIVMFQGHGNINIKNNINPLYENFLLAHELGHYLLHYDEDISFSFLLNCYKNKLEKEANEFACRLLLNDVSFDENTNIEFIIKEKGIPLKIWYSLSDKLLPNLYKREETA